MQRRTGTAASLIETQRACAVTTAYTDGAPHATAKSCTLSGLAIARDTARDNCARRVNSSVTGGIGVSVSLRGVKRRSNLSFGGAGDCFAALAMTIFRHT